MLTTSTPIHFIAVPTALSTRVAKLILSLLLLALQVFSIQAYAAPTPAGTIISNTASSAQTTSLGAQLSSSNTVTAVVAAAIVATPTLMKFFDRASMAPDQFATLSFFVTNVAGNPAQAGISFIDTLPSGLLLSAGSVVNFSGCSGISSLVQPSAISVSALTMAAGVTTCRVDVSLIVPAVGLLNPSCAAFPPNYTNSATSISGLANLTNQVTPQCMVVRPLSPSITKAFGRAGISDGDTTSLMFTVTNSAGSPNQQGISFSDNLPAGLALKNAVAVVNGTGCAAQSIAFSAPATIAVNDLAMSAGTAVCTVIVSGISNRNGALNPTQCGALNSPDFTNDANSLSGLVNLVNNITPQCMIVFSAPKLTKQFGASRLLDGANTALTFTLTNDASAPALAGISFIDTLPAGLTLLPNAAFSIQGAGCMGEVTLAAPSQIAVGNFAFSAGAVVCTITVTGVSNKVGSLNPTACGATNAVDFTNDATSISGLLKLTNAVTPQCLLVGPALPTLTKKFADTRLIDGESTALIFSIANSPSLPAISGVAFTDTLPNSLRLSSNPTFAFREAGCSGQVTLNAPSQIAVSNFSIAAGVPTCTLIINGVTNALGALNSSCKDTPPLFTNSANSISNTLGIVNAVQNACLVVNPPDVIRGFVDNGFRLPTLLALVGKNIFFSANAPSCNQNPDIVERRIVVITGANGEREEIVSVETGPNTGIFTTTGLSIRPPPVVANDSVLEGKSGDTYSVEILGCGRKIVTTLTVVDPNGVVFDSRTNEPVQGAVVTLVNSVNGICARASASVSTLNGNQIVPSPNPVTTGADGRFEFPLVTPDSYCLRVVAPNGYTWTSLVPANQLPVGRNILATGPSAITGGSYGGSFRVGPDTGPIIIDIPVDPGAIAGLFIQKSASRTVVEIGEFADYTVTVNNNAGVALNRADVLVVDNLPAGFTYVAGSARVEGKPIADPAGKGGPRITFNVGRMAVAQQIKLDYRVRVGPGAQQGDGVNRAVANYRTGSALNLYSESNTAIAKVTVVGGVFTDKGYIVGKVYTDCNKDRIQNENEVGIPGIRIYLEDGTNIITDAEGKFSFYGVSPRTHVLKIDRTSLPAGLTDSDFIDLSNRNLGKADSRFVDLKNGELHKADFAVQTCSNSVMAEVGQRRKSASGLKTEVDGRLQQKLETDNHLRALSDVKALPASGLVGDGATVAAAPGAGSFLAPNARPDATSTSLPPLAPGTLNSVIKAGEPGAETSGIQTKVAPPPGFQTLAPDGSPRDKLLADSSTPTPVIPLENILPDENNTLGFIGLKNGDIVAIAQTNIRIKGATGVTFKLVVNGKEITNDRVGKKAILDDKKLQAWEYIGVDLLPGNNSVSVSQWDQFGNQRGESSIKLLAPGALSKVLIEFPDLPNGGAVANGKTPVKFVVRITDADGVPVTSRTAITIFASLGRLDVEDLNPVEPGVQTFVADGRREFKLLPPNDPGEAQIFVSGGPIKSTAKLDFLPDLRDLLAVGVIEGVLNLRKLDSRALVPARAQDGFDQEITHLSRTWNDGKYDAGARAAMFIKGKIKGEYLLTLAYDSDKNTRERLFRDIQPDEFYPVYGDSSVRGFDAQSTGRFYVRVDNKKSYLLYGDYNTQSMSEARKLAAYSRSLTGLKEHFETSNISANIFASRDSTKQLIQEFRANGTSGPFTLSNAQGLINSEKIEILTRDRSQNAIVIKSVPQARFVDYELEPLTGRILFKAPIPSLDENLNPFSIRITYEVDQGGTEFWVAGADAQFKISDRFEIGGIIVDDRNPVDKFRMAGVNAIAKLADRTFLIAEVAQTNREKIAAGLSDGEKQGRAARVEFKHQSENIDAAFYAGRADEKFDNQSSSLSAGRLEVGGKLAYKLDEKTRIKGEFLRTEEIVSGSKRDGILLSAERAFENGLRLELGVRHARESQGTSASANTSLAPAGLADSTLPPSSATAASPANTAVGAAPNEVTAIRARLTGDVPGVKDASMYGELEVDPSNTSRKIAAVGGEYKLANNGRLYARHEFISSLTGPYGLNTTQRQNSTVVGLNTDYMKDGNLFSEYRIRDAISGGDAEAAFGLRNLWTVAEGVRLSTGFERVHAFSGNGQSEATAATFGLDYTANPLWKGSTRLELRDGKTSDSILSTIAVASKLNREWTFLGRNTFSLIRNKGEQSGENQQDRLQAGLAFRETEADVWNALGRIEHRIEKDTTQQGIELKRTVELISIHANWQPRRPFTFSSRYAAKWTNDQSNGLRTKNNAQLLAGRAIWEFAPRWDLSAQVSTLLGKGAQSKQYSAGLELGFMVMENLWLSGGYNFFGFRDEDLASGDYTNKGAYVRLRYKFDEDLFGRDKSQPKAQPVSPLAPADVKKSGEEASVEALSTKAVAIPVLPAPVLTTKTELPQTEPPMADKKNEPIVCGPIAKHKLAKPDAVKLVDSANAAGAPSDGAKAAKPVKKKKSGVKPLPACDSRNGAGTSLREDDAQDEDEADQYAEAVTMIENSVSKSVDPRNNTSGSQGFNEERASR